MVHLPRLHRATLALLAVTLLGAGPFALADNTPPAASTVFKSPALAAMAESLARGDTNAGLLGRSRGADMNAAGYGGTRPIHYVVRYIDDRSLGALRAMISQGADVSATDLAGNTALGLAASRQSAAAVQILLGFSASPSQPSAGKPPVQIALEAGNRAAFEMLAPYGSLQGPSYQRGSASSELVASGRYEWALWMAKKGLLQWRTEPAFFWSRLCPSSDAFATLLVSTLQAQGAQACHR